MRKINRNILIIIVFIGMITLPQILFFVLGKQEGDFSITENRKLSPKPIIELATIKDYPLKFDNYLEDHLPFRNELRGVWAKMNYILFNTSVDTRVIIGKDKWLFYNNEDDGNPLGQLQGNVEYDRNFIMKMTDNLNENTKKLENEHIKFGVMVIANKERVYANKLPNIICKSELDKTAQLIRDVNNGSKTNILYVNQELANLEADTYYIGDTHWNSYGAYIGTMKLEEAIEPDFKTPNISIKNDAENRGDLVNFANLNALYSKEMSYKVNGFLDGITYKEDKIQDGEVITTSENALKNETLLLIGDSFRENMMPFLSKIYKKVIYFHNSKYTEDKIQEYNPDIVVLETVERYIKSLADYKI